MKENKQPKEDQMLEILQDMNKDMKEIKKRLVEVEQVTGLTSATDQTTAIIGDVVEDDTIQDLKIHPIHRKIVDSILGEQFKAWETYDDTNSTHFMFHVQVPIKLSSIPEHEQKSGKSLDIRTKAISNAEGENGVQEWCKKIRQNLNKYYTVHGIRSPFTTSGL